VLVHGISLNSLLTYNGTIGQKIKRNEVRSKSNVRNVVGGIFGRSFSITYNVLRLGVCYFALQILQVLDKFNRQNNSTKPLLVAGAVN
jgi:hypothetical protein